MRLENAFEVPAPLEQAWALVTDVPRVAPCMPGAQLTEIVDDDTFKATMSVKLGPIALQFAADITRRLDEDGRRVVLDVKSRELRGRGRAEATIESTLTPQGDGTQISIVTELSLQGAVAQYGRSVVPDVSRQLVSQFADAVADVLSQPA